MEVLLQRCVDRVGEGESWTLLDAVCAGRLVKLPRHPDEMVTRFVDQVATASQAQAAHRVRPLRFPSDLFVFGPERQEAHEADCIGLEWEEVRPRVVERMSA